MPAHKVVSREEWTAARKAFLAKEKEFTKARDALSAARRDLPWMKIDKNYVFDTVGGKKSLAELFDGRSQLVIYHFMFGPDWNAGCPHCSHWADSFKSAEYNFTRQDPGTSEREGLSIFYKDTDGSIYRTYSSYARGIDLMCTDYNYLDLVPKGRDENGRGPFWVKRHDEYENVMPRGGCCG